MFLFHNSISWNPGPEAFKRIILVQHTFLYMLELTRAALLSVSAYCCRLRLRTAPWIRGRRREQFGAREQGPANLTHPGTAIIRSGKNPHSDHIYIYIYISYKLYIYISYIHIYIYIYILIVEMNNQLFEHALNITPSLKNLLYIYS